MSVIAGCFYGLAQLLTNFTHSVQEGIHYYYYYYGNRTQGTVVTQKYNQIERKKNKGKSNQINWYTKSEWYNQPRP